MIFFTNAYRREGAEWSVVLQQFTRQDGVPILFACLFQGDAKGPERITDWIYEEVLALCEWGKAARCTDKVGKAFQHRYQTLGCGNASLALFFAMDEECFYARQGKGQLYFFQLLFDKVKGRPLARNSSEEGENIGYERAVWEPRTGILLGSAEFLEALEQSGADTAACLRASELKTEEQAGKHLRELCTAVASRGVRDTAAVFCMAVRR